MSEIYQKKQFEFEELVHKYFVDPTPDLRDLIIVKCAPMVERIARKFAGIEPVDDLSQVGYIGLLNALSKYDPNAGVLFNTYATHLIAGEIKHYLRDRSMTIRHPAWLQELRHKVNKAVNQLHADLGRPPVAREVAEHLSLSVSAIEEVFATQDLLRVGSLDAPSSDDASSESEVERIDSSLIVGEQTSVEDRVLLESAMSQLRDLEREVLVLFHFEALNQTEIAAKLGISCNYVSHILRQSLSKLRRILSNEEAIDRSLQIGLPTDSPVIIDSDTGLYTYAYFKNRMSEELHRVQSAGGAVGLIRIHLVGIRMSREGHGDQSVRDLIQDAAYAMKELTRSLDLVCRDGHYGFAIIMPLHGDHAAQAAARLQAGMNQWLVGRVSPTSPVRLDFGFACGADQGRSFAELLEAARPKGVDNLDIAV